MNPGRRIAWGLMLLMVLKVPAQDADQIAPLPYPELVYLHLNQDLFLAGDTIWAGIHLIESNSRTPSQLSNLAYVEVWAQSGEPVIRQRIWVPGGHGMAMLPIPEELLSGYYLIRGYTRWMRNGPASHYFQHFIRIVNPESPPPLEETPAALAPYVVDWHIEGGRLLADQPVVIHLRTKGWNERPVSVGARLIGEATWGHSEIQIQTDEQGYARVEFTPEGQEMIYHLEVETGEGNFTMINLGQAHSDGYSMHVVPNHDLGVFHIFAGIHQEEGRLTLVGEQRGKPFFSRQIRLGPEESSTLHASELDLPPGSSRIMLIDEEGQLLCERFLWNPHPTQSARRAAVPDMEQILPLTTASGRPVAPGHQFSVNAETFPASSQPVRFSMLRGMPDSKVMGMWDYLYLAAGLPQPYDFDLSMGEGAVEGALAFQTSHPDQRLQTSQSPWLKAETAGMILEGTVSDQQGIPKPGAELFLVIPGDKPWLQRTECDSTGTFVFMIPPSLGQPEITMIRGGQDVLPSWRIELRPAFAEAPIIDHWPALVLRQSEWDLLESKYLHQQLRQRYLDPGAREPEPGGLFSGMAFYGAPDFVYRFSDFTTMPTEEAFIEFISEARLRRRNGRRVLLLNELSGEAVFPGPPLLLIDGVPVFDSQTILDVGYRLVDRVELVNQSFVLNGRQYNGILHLITYQQDASSVQLKDSDLRLNLLLVSPTEASHLQVLQGRLTPSFSVPDIQLYGRYFPEGEQMIRFFRMQNVPRAEEIRVQAISEDGMIWEK